MNQGLDTTADAVPEKDISHLNEPQRLDLSEASADKSLDIHKLAFIGLHTPEALAQVRVFDLENVLASDVALREIDRVYIKPLFLIEAFARHYRESLLRVLTRGNEKGRSVLDPTASTYEHPIASGGALVVNAETVEHEGQYIRRLTITFVKEMQKEGAK
jgi:hypothetical protein